METTMRISPEELTDSWLKNVKALFGNVRKLEITIRPASDLLSLVDEDRESYVTRINAAIRNLESGKDTVTFSKEEFDKFLDKQKQSK